MKHLHFVQSIEPLEGGGLGRAALELSAAMRMTGCGSHLVTTGHASCAPQEGVDVFERSGPTRAFYARGLHVKGGCLVAESDVVHGHGFYVATNWLLGREARKRRKPLVYHPHGMFDPWIVARSRGKKRLAHWLFENANFRHAGVWRALTLVEADQIRAQGITAPIIVCPNGIDLETFTPVAALKASLNGQKRVRSLLFLARLHPKKGLDMLIQAWARLPQTKRDAWQLVIAGPDELGHRKEIEALAVRLGVAAQVQFTGLVTAGAKLRCLAEADAFVLPSRSEGFPVAILEAMACELPVLATTACNFPTLGSEGGGWVVDATVDGISEGLEGLLSASAGELAQRGAAGRALVERAYLWPKIAKQIAFECERFAK
ncbi:MAG TPA: glycosyltransferase [Rariglobus sp.]|nr:glycosyltransferase [Rariglobus sp.]